jgi:hypothetical protein
MTSAAGGNTPRATLSRGPAFWLVAGAWLLLLFAAGGPDGRPAQ